MDARLRRTVSVHLRITRRLMGEKGDAAHFLNLVPDLRIRPCRGWILTGSQTQDRSGHAVAWFGKINQSVVDQIVSFGRREYLTETKEIELREFSMTRRARAIFYRSTLEREMSRAVFHVALAYFLSFPAKSMFEAIEVFSENRQPLSHPHAFGMPNERLRKRVDILPELEFRKTVQTIERLQEAGATQLSRGLGYLLQALHPGLAGATRILLAMSSIEACLGKRRERLSSDALVDRIKALQLPHASDTVGYFRKAYQQRNIIIHGGLDVPLNVCGLYTFPESINPLAYRLVDGEIEAIFSALNIARSILDREIFNVSFATSVTA